MTVPSARKASACAYPAAMATTLVRSFGTMVWPDELSPQATTVLAAKPVGMERNRHTRNRHHTLPTNRQHPTFNIEHSTSNRSEVGSGIECSVFDVGC